MAVTLREPWIIISAMMTIPKDKYQLRSMETVVTQPHHYKDTNRLAILFSFFPPEIPLTALVSLPKKRGVCACRNVANCNKCLMYSVESLAFIDFTRILFRN